MPNIQKFITKMNEGMKNLQNEGKKLDRNIKAAIDKFEQVSHHSQKLTSPFP
jgi:hypothetical protein